MKQIAEQKMKGSRPVTENVIFSGQVLKCVQYSTGESDQVRLTLPLSQEDRVILFPMNKPLVSRRTNGGFDILGQKEVVCVSDPSQLDLIGQKSGNSIRVLTWRSKLSPQLDALFSHAGKSGAAVTLSASPRLPEISDLHLRLTDFLANPIEYEESMVFAAAQMISISALRSTEYVAFAVIPSEVAKGLKSLSSEVRDNPEAAWSLKFAAEYAGYSQFHLSRVFRSEFGIGFPEYVDRCRLAVVLSRCKTKADDPTKIALEVGYLTPAAFRESLKSYLGLLPSELRKLI